MDIKEILKKELNKKYKINESLTKISLLNEEERFFETFNYLDHLISEGYSEDELKDVINEKWDFLKNILGMNPSKNDTPQDEVIKTGGSGALSQFNEYIVKYLLGLLGFKGPLASAFSTFISEMSFTELVSLVKGKDGCTAHSSQIAKAIMESLVTYIIQNNTKKDSVAYNFLRNSLFEYLKNQGFTKKVGDLICAVLYKNRTSLLSF